MPTVPENPDAELARLTDRARVLQGEIAERQQELHQIDLEAAFVQGVKSAQNTDAPLKVVEVG